MRRWGLPLFLIRLPWIRSLLLATSSLSPWRLAVLCLAVPVLVWGGPGASEAQERPHIVVILADDLGYGDVEALNLASDIPTININRLAREGLTFLDGHSPSAVCTPTRYGLLTGRYCWRTRLKSGVLGGYSPPLIEPDRETIASVLKEHGYVTGAVGKWHLGMTLPYREQANADRSPWEGDPGIDFGGMITDGPTQHGFDYYFGVSASLDMAPYVFIRNDRFTALPTLQQPAVPFPHFVRRGPRAEDFVMDEVLDRLTDEAVGFIERSAADDQPFFLYFPMTAPHKPAQPHARFRGKTGLNEYGDFVLQVDWCVGRVLDALDDAGITENTVVFFSSDNGSYMHKLTPDKRDHVDDAGVQGFRLDRHTANGPFRGTKADIYEAGHHVPFFVRWPARITAGSECSATVCLVDLFATCAEISGAQLPAGAAPDSVSLWPLITGQAEQRTTPVVHHSAGGMFAIRQGKWKLILGNGSGGRERPAGKPFAQPYQLYDLLADPRETTNMAEKHPQVVAELTAALTEIRGE